MTKKEVRRHVLSKLCAISKERRYCVEQFFSEQLQCLPQWKEAQTVGITLSMFPEWETRGIIQLAIEQGKRIALPKVLTKEKMIFVYYALEDSVKKSVFGVEEPLGDDEVEHIDLLIVPGVAFNDKGYRLGFGGGYYDRYLASFKGNTVSFVSKEQCVDFPIEKHDIPVQQLIIENVGEYRV
ncbi:MULTISPECIES: 5-formyltetrahydrofolate cyclo-ligase [unclassified Granulicatella]|uniref:5-formyltetrahydrofolate cyclo-ligase n=1 Tax=unclassified Granulicatella TaxID=2630493 RepID=UPI0010734DB7|nr:MULTISPECIES: 5-formyltetrahydrofolate cyclo-ligase [unclassified Granulicatella]MBF0780992.1 5-formyltetrahydrofolate cyclo-ligase [Granulicatella sp. 19428wC4_WM01]TFU92723.1 5-formyltetrahydrofolate cyclo-ligase [Granulicatella sp. WM01]